MAKRVQNVQFTTPQVVKSTSNLLRPPTVCRALNLSVGFGQ